MIKKLIDIGVPCDIAKDIIRLFEKYDRHPHFYPPNDPFVPFHVLSNNVKTIISSCDCLMNTIRNLSTFEKSFLDAYGCPDLEKTISQLRKAAKITSRCYGESPPHGEDRIQQGKLSLAHELKQLLEFYGYKVKKYRNNLFCKIINILLQIKDDETGNEKTSDIALNLLREISKPNFTPNFF